MARTYLRADIAAGRPVWAVPNETDPFLSGVATWTSPDLTIDENPFSITFETLANVNLASGVWNKPKSRLEC